MAYFDVSSKPVVESSATPRRKHVEEEPSSPEQVPKIARTSSRQRPSCSKPKRPSSPSKKSSKKSKDEGSDCVTKRVLDAISAGVKPVEEQLKSIATINESLTKRSTSLEASMTRSQAKLSAALAEVSKQTGSLDKRVAQMDKRHQLALDEERQKISRLESVLAGAVRVAEAAAKEAKASREEAEARVLALERKQFLNARHETEKVDQPGPNTTLSHEKSREVELPRSPIGTKTQSNTPESPSIELIAGVLERQSRQLEYLLHNSGPLQHPPTQQQVHGGPPYFASVSSSSFGNQLQVPQFYPPPLAPWQDFDRASSTADLERVLRQRRSNWFHGQ